eukprot:PhM_4_TR14345/c0_g1_i1/m.37995
MVRLSSLLIMMMVLMAATILLGADAAFVRAPGATLKVCSFYFGTLQDLGYTFSFHKGRLAAQETLVAMYPDITIHNIYENEVFVSGMNRTQNIIDYVAHGCHVIISNSNDNFADNDGNDISFWAAQTYRNVSFIIGGDSNKPLTWSE